MLHDIDPNRYPILFTSLVDADDFPVLWAHTNEDVIRSHLRGLFLWHVVVQRLVFAADNATVNEGDVVDESHSRRTDERRDEGVTGVLVQCFRRGDLLNNALFEDTHAITHGHCLSLVVGDIDRGGVELALQLKDLRTRGYAELRIQIGEGLIHEKDFGLAHDSAPHGHTLALATRHCGGLAIDKVLQLQHFRSEAHALFDGCLIHLGILQCKRHVLTCCHVGVQRIGLEHHGYIAVPRAGLGNVGPVDEDLAFVDWLKASEHAQCRGLAATRRSDEY